MFTFLFGSPIRRALKKTLNNRIKNAEIALKAETKNLAEVKANAKAAAIAQYKNEMQNIHRQHKSRGEEIITKRVNDILGIQN